MEKLGRRKRKTRNTEKEISHSTTLFLRRFYKPIIVVISIIAFFITYNTYLVDRSLRDIEFALAETANAQTLGDIEGLEALVQTALLKEIGPRQLDSESTVQLEFAQDIISEGNSMRQLKDVEAMLKEVSKKKRVQRFGMLNVVDRVSAVLKDAKDRVTYIFSQLAVKTPMFAKPDQKAIELARELDEKGEVEEAIKEYEKALEIIPRYQGKARLELAIAYQKNGRFKKAEHAYGKIMKADPDSREARLAKRFLEGLKELKFLEHKKKRIAQDISKAITPSKQQKLYYELGSINISLSDFKAAEEAYLKSYKIDQSTDLGRKAKFNLAWALKMQGKAEEAEDTFMQLSKESPGTELARDSKYWVADTLRDEGKYQESIETFKEISGDFKGTKFALVADFKVGYSYLYDLNDPASANKVFKKLGREYSGTELAEYVKSDIIPEVGSIYRDRGFNLILKGEWSKAAEEFQKAISYNAKDARSHSGLGASKALMAQWQEALPKARKGKELAPDDGYVYANLGYLHILKREYDAALTEYQEAINFNPRYTEALYNLGWLFSLKGNHDAAIVYYKKAIAIKPDFLEAHNNLGETYWNKGMYTAAENEFKMSIKINPNYAAAHFNLGVSYMATKKYTQAKREFEQVLDK